MDVMFDASTLEEVPIVCPLSESSDLPCLFARVHESFGSLSTMANFVRQISFMHPSMSPALVNIWFIVLVITCNWKGLQMIGKSRTFLAIYLM